MPPSKKSVVFGQGLSRAFGLLLAGLLFSFSVHAEILPGQLEVVSSKRLSFTDYEYVYRLSVSNTGGDVTNLSAKVSAPTSNPVLLDDSLEFADIVAGGSGASVDTFSIRLNRRQANSLNLLTYSFTFDEDNGVVDADEDGYSADEDCDDSDPAINPGATEVGGNEVDENCDGVAEDVDGDGFSAAQNDCNDSDAAINPNVEEIAGNDVDENCDGFVDPGEPDPDDLDGDGFASAEDCDDNDAAINPGADSIPNNGIDEDCDGLDPIVAASLAVRITSPKSLITVGASPLAITGTLDDPSAALTVNGVVVTADAEGNFSANVALQEGHNSVVARAVKDGTQVTDSIAVSLDLTEPQVTIESHSDGQKVFTDKITVTGLINDIVRGTIEASQASVTVNGVQAAISNRSYSAKNIPLQVGSNSIEVLGVDQVGNVGRRQIAVNYTVPAGRRLDIVGGDDQTAAINTILPEPLAVQVLNDAGEGVGNASVVFRVIQGSGVVAAGTDKEGRAVVVSTDADGMAETPFKLGVRVGSANQKVRAQVVGYETLAVFNASATGNIGNKISINSGNNQRGAVGQLLPEALVVVVTDDGANVVKDARVLFKVTRGRGELSGVGSGEFGSQLQVQTDSDGRATAEYKLGFLAGLDAQRITATLLDAPTDDQGNLQLITAGFSATAFVPADPGATTVSGVVLDNQDNPLSGVTVRISGTERQDATDDQGKFLIEEAPVGPVHLIADGSTTTVEGEFPALSYNIVTIAGVDNPLSAPIYMVKLNSDGAVFAGPQDVDLELASYPGFKLRIIRNSVTFPDGARQGLVSVTPVNASTVPMAPPNGMQPQFIVTIQPTGTRFDPPAPLTLPNVDGHRPGAQVEMYSYDHDLEEFVSIGLGTVSEDGSLVQSNPGVGVVKAGWHCGSQPGGQGCAHNCPDCERCDANCNCVADSSKDGTETSAGGCCYQGSSISKKQSYDDLQSKCKSPVQDTIRPHEVDGCSGGIQQNPTRAGGLYIPSLLWSQDENLSATDFGIPQPGLNIPHTGLTGFIPAPCNNHDICYQSCGRTQKVCDDEIFDDMVAVCNAAYPSPCPASKSVFQCLDYFDEAAYCNQMANEIWLGLRAFGSSAYEERQGQFCNCCGS
ncbi:MAG: hypothetical protein GYB33_12985 [Gammaproteobacteria bacterium]|nr:hypothetical protein [Gammaproteobacteria bacterium]